MEDKKLEALKRELLQWILDGKKKKATHMIDVCDTFDYDNYPVYVKKGESLEEKEKEVRAGSMQRINRVLDLSSQETEDLIKQLTDELAA